MSYTVDIQPRARRQIASWDLGDVLVDVYLELRERLPANLRALQPSRQRRGGSLYRFRVPDPVRPGRVHHFVFRVLFSQGEDKLIIERGGHISTEGSWGLR